MQNKSDATPAAFRSGSQAQRRTAPSDSVTRREPSTSPTQRRKAASKHPHPTAQRHRAAEDRGEATSYSLLPTSTMPAGASTDGQFQPDDRLAGQITRKGHSRDERPSEDSYSSRPRAKGKESAEVGRTFARRPPQEANWQHTWTPNADAASTSASRDIPRAYPSSPSHTRADDHSARSLALDGETRAHPQRQAVRDGTASGSGNRPRARTLDVGSITRNGGSSPSSRTGLVQPAPRPVARVSPGARPWVRAGPALAKKVVVTDGLGGARIEVQGQSAGPSANQVPVDNSAIDRAIERILGMHMPSQEREIFSGPASAPAAIKAPPRPAATGQQDPMLAFSDAPTTSYAHTPLEKRAYNAHRVPGLLSSPVPFGCWTEWPFDSRQSSVPRESPFFGRQPRDGQSSRTSPLGPGDVPPTVRFADQPLDPVWSSRAPPPGFCFDPGVTAPALPPSLRPRAATCGVGTTPSPYPSPPLAPPANTIHLDPHAYLPAGARPALPTPPLSGRGRGNFDPLLLDPPFLPLPVPGREMVDNPESATSVPPMSASSSRLPEPIGAGVRNGSRSAATDSASSPSASAAWTTDPQAGQVGQVGPIGRPRLGGGLEMHVGQRLVAHIGQEEQGRWQVRTSDRDGQDQDGYEDHDGEGQGDRDEEEDEDSAGLTSRIVACAEAVLGEEEEDEGEGEVGAAGPVGAWREPGGRRDQHEGNGETRKDETRTRTGAEERHEEDPRSKR